MMVIGLTGSIAMGKSEAARYLASLGFPVFDSDAEVHKLYESKAGAELVRSIAPQAILQEKVDRPALSAIVLNNQALLNALEKLVHAEIRKRRIAFLSQARATKVKAAILDIPLLFETAAEVEVDRVIVVSAPPEIQRQRALARPGMTPERLQLILARQMPDAEKRRRADAIIDTSSTVQQMQKSLHELCIKWGLISHA